LSGLVKPLLAGPARHLARLLGDADYRALAVLEARFGRRPRYAPGRARVRGRMLEFPDAASFLASYREIFVQRQYAFPWPGPAPRILDLGANIGLSALFFKTCHPRAEILAVEADPAIFRYLERNLRANAVTGVELLNRVAWSGAGRIAFRPEGADAGRAIAPAGEGGSGTIEIEALDLPALLAQRPFDVIKMDIEGAEATVVPVCREGLARARFVAIEYHSTVGKPQALAGILTVLEACGFRVHVHSVITSPVPFVEQHTHTGFDMQLNLFAWKA
jgi:FkbM family methyltransferase